METSISENVSINEEKFLENNNNESTSDFITEPTIIPLDLSQKILLEIFTTNI